MKLKNYIIASKILLLLCLTNLILTSSTYAQTLQTATIGNTAGAGSWLYGPLYRNTSNSGLLNYSRHAYLYTQAELGIPAGAQIVKLEWLKKDGGTIASPNAFNVWLKNTTATSFPVAELWSSLVSGADQTYTNSAMPLTIGNNIYLEIPFNVAANDTFNYTGQSLQILTDWQKVGVQSGIGITFYYNSATDKSLGIPSSTPLTGTTLLQAATYGNFRPTIRITYFIPSVPLPVSLLLFVGKDQGSSVQLTWATTAEKNSSYFIVERSIDAQAFMPISSAINTLVSGGNSNEQLTYAFNDVSPNAGHNYYRLKMVDIDGQINYSGIIEVNKIKTLDVKTYPNPINTELFITIHSPIKTDVLVKVNDIQGNVLRSNKMAIQEGENLDSINLQALSKGNYFISITNNQGINYLEHFQKN